MLNHILINTQNPQEKYHMPFFSIPEGSSRDEMHSRLKALKDAGVESFIGAVRSSEYMGWAFWKDMDIMIDEVQKLGMSFWIQDEQNFPTGEANGWVKKRRPDLGKEFIKARYTDAVGPLSGASFNLYYWLDPNNRNDIRRYLVETPLEGSDAGLQTILRNVPKLERPNELIQVVAYRKNGEDGSIYGDPVDLNANVKEGYIFWDVPEGFWRIFIIMKTYYSTGRRIYINVINQESVRLLIDALYEPMYDRYAKHFGKTFKGFFTDEPEFGNDAGYGAARNTGIGKQILPLPWCSEMSEIMRKTLGDDYYLYLPALWYDAGSILNAKIRYIYMDCATKLYQKNFTEQIGQWCREHGCLYTGHLHEDADQHARLGSGTGHFFRSMAGQDISGIDFVRDNLLPGFDSVNYAWCSRSTDGEEFTYATSKLGSSLAHITPGMKGRALCETFGAYESIHGLKHLKWACDHMLSRGINHMMANFRKTRGFFTGTYNPQYQYYSVLTQYLTRVCNLLNGGIHSAPVAVLYHAEAEWAGQYMNSARPIKKLAQAQIDCDIIPTDVFSERDYFKTFLKDGLLHINDEIYMALVIPYSEYITATLAKFIMEANNVNFPVIFIENLPTGLANIAGNEGDKLMDAVNRCKVVPLEQTGLIVREMGLYHIEITPQEDGLRYYRYINNGITIYMLFNENAYLPISTQVTFPETSACVLYDALSNRFYDPNAKVASKTTIEVTLSPYETCYIIFGDVQGINLSEIRKLNKRIPLVSEWFLAKAEAEENAKFNKSVRLDKLENLGAPGKYQTFDGVLNYSTEFVMSNITGKVSLDLGMVYETAQVWVNEVESGIRISPPYIFEIDGLLKEGVNKLRVVVTGTGRNGDSETSMFEPLGLIGDVALLIE